VTTGLFFLFPSVPSRLFFRRLTLGTRDKASFALQLLNDDPSLLPLVQAVGTPPRSFSFAHPSLNLTLAEFVRVANPVNRNPTTRQLAALLETLPNCKSFLSPAPPFVQDCDVTDYPFPSTLTAYRLAPFRCWYDDDRHHKPDSNDPDDSDVANFPFPSLSPSSTQTSSSPLCPSSRAMACSRCGSPVSRQKREWGRLGLNRNCSTRLFRRAASSGSTCVLTTRRSGRREMYGR
jgi:hypothetical protein